MPSLLDEIAELLLKALALPAPAGFVYVHRGGHLDGVELLVEETTRARADKEALRIAQKHRGELIFVREQKANSTPTPSKKKAVRVATKRTAKAETRSAAAPASSSPASRSRSRKAK
jgi:hypothetical protein